MVKGSDEVEQIKRRGIDSEPLLLPFFGTQTLSDPLAMRRNVPGVQRFYGNYTGCKASL